VGPRLAVVGGGRDGRTRVGPVDERRRVEGGGRVVVRMVVRAGRGQQGRVRRRWGRGRSVGRKGAAEVGAQHSGTYVETNKWVLLR